MDGIIAVFALTTAILVAVYRSPERNALDGLVMSEGRRDSMNIFQRAFNNLNLTPGERAFLKLLSGFANAGIVSLLLAIPTVLSFQAGQPVIAAGGVGVMVGSFVHGFLAAWQKYTSAKGDAPLANAIGAAQQAADVRFGLPDAHIELPVPAAVDQPVEQPAEADQSAA